MRGLKLVVVAGAVFFTLSACLFEPESQESSPSSTAESLYANPSPLPEFITDVVAESHMFFSRAICITINQEPLWVRGYTAEEIYDHMVAHLRFTVDGDMVPNSEVEIMVAPMAYPVYDENHAVIGLYGGPATACFDSTQFEPGLHVAAVELKDLSGRESSYTWAFRCGENQELPPTIAVLPSD